MRSEMKTALAILAICATPMASATFGGAQAAATSGTCSKLADTEFVTSDALDYTNSEDWIGLSDGLINFISKKSGCVIVTLSGTSDADINTILRVRTVLDGATICGPGLGNDADIFAEDPPFGAHSMTYVCKDVPAGSHSVQMQYKSFNGDHVVAFRGHTLTVTHN